MKCVGGRVSAQDHIGKLLAFPRPLAELMEMGTYGVRGTEKERRKEGRGGSGI